MPKKFDDIQLKIQPAGKLCLPYPDVDRAIILINGKDILDIVLKEQERLGREEKFNYHQMRVSELYDYLVESENQTVKRTQLSCVAPVTRWGVGPLLRM